MDGALIASGRQLRLLVARADGTGPAQALTKAFDAIAAKSGQPLAVTDVAPPLADDSEALSPFFVILGVLIPSLAAGSASALVFRRARPAWSVAAPAVVAVAIGLVAAGIADGVSGLGHYAAIAAIVALFSLAVSAPMAALGRIWPPLVSLVLLVFLVFGIPASGGPANLAPFGPAFLRPLHPALPLGAAADALRGAVYFDGYGTAGPVWVLAVWAVAGVTALALVVALRRPAPAGTVPGDAFPAPPVSLVVGFDNSEPARRALSWTVRQAAARPAVLRIVYADHVIVNSDLSGFAHAEMAAAQDQEAAEVAGAAAEIAAGSGVPYTFERRPGAPADAILSSASAQAAAGRQPTCHRGRPVRARHSSRARLGARSAPPSLAVPCPGRPVRPLAEPWSLIRARRRLGHADTRCLTYHPGRPGRPGRSGRTRP